LHGSQVSIAPEIPDFNFLLTSITYETAPRNGFRWISKMTDISLSRSKEAAPKAGLLQSLIERVQNVWLFSRAEAELHGLSDYQLADLGLSRSQIGSAVRGDLRR
jgi:uncharacterized protein YjiS (DUF1127 family)